MATTTPDSIEDKLQKRQVANILKKAQDGKVLTAREERIISEYQSDRNPKKQTKTMVQGKSALYYRTGFSRPTIDAWHKHPDFPKPNARGEYCLEDVIGWVRDKGYRGGETTEVQKIKQREAELRCMRLEFELEAEKGKWVHQDTVRTDVMKCVNEAKSLLRSKFENEAPPILEGLTAAQIQDYLKKAIDEVCTILSS